jgi:RHS repeat-associated protein
MYDGTAHHALVTHKFTGKERDGESGLDNFIARYNSSSLGRFMSPDPFNIAGDFVDSQDPQHWNMYSYVLNNPVNAVDPDGLGGWPTRRFYVWGF